MELVLKNSAERIGRGFSKNIKRGFGMSEKIRVIGYVNHAAEFVLENKGQCITRAIPYLIFLTVINFAAPLLGNSFEFLSTYAEQFLYAMFAVSWHRFSILSSERVSSGLSYRFGMREFRFTLLLIASTVVLQLASHALLFILPPVLAVILLFIILIPVVLTLFFVYPAIALDQPIRIQLFFNEAIKHLSSFGAALVAVILYVFIVGIVIALIAWILNDILSPQVFSLLSFAVFSLIVTPIVMAITVSTATFLYRDVIGFVGSGETAAEVS